MRGGVVVAVGALLALVSASARAQSSPLEPSPFFDGTGTVRDARLVITCRAEGERWLACDARGSFRIDARERSELDPQGGELDVDGQRVSDRITLEAGRTARVRARWSFRLPLTPPTEEEMRYPDFGGEPFQFSPIRARHPWLGHRYPPYGPPAGRRLIVFSGHEVELEGGFEVESRGEGASVHRVVDRSERSGRYRLEVRARPTEAEPVLHGGPFVSVGGGGGLQSHRPGPWPRLAVGYEIAFVDYLVLGLAFETDLDSIAQSLVLEVASPQYWFVAPSVAAGVGIVARQLGPRDADAALRLRATLTWPVLGVVADFDYWPAIGSWSMAFVGRVGF